MNWASALRTQHTLQSNVHCAVKSSAVPKVTQSRNFNCTNVRNFQHTVDLTVQLLTVQLKLKVKLYVCGASYSQGALLCRKQKEYYFICTVPIASVLELIVWPHMLIWCLTLAKSASSRWGDSTNDALSQ